MTATTEVAVLGAGAVGVTVAADLAAAGADGTVYDPGGVAAGSTGRAAGVCYMRNRRNTRSFTAWIRAVTAGDSERFSWTAA